MSRSASPAVEPVTINGQSYRPVREGLASILAPYQQSNGTAQKGHNNDEGNQAVFYNPIQQFNRDLTVLAILIYGEGALVAKDLVQSRKSKNRKVKSDRRKHGQAPRDGGGDITDSKKRKVDEVDLPAEHGTLKRPRTDDVGVEVDELEVAQLNADEATAPKPMPGNEQMQTPFTILDALSATGLRALRYAKEIPFATNIIANDLSKDAVQSIEVNIDHNKVSDRVYSNVGDARAYMYSKIGNERQQSSDGYVHRFDVVDLDPYGTAEPFIDAALQTLTDGGLLCVTCTDAGVFASSGYLEKTYALYGGLPIKGVHSHEAGLRLIVSSIASTAAKYGIAIEPLLSLSIDFYARVFIRVHKRPSDVKLLAGTTMVTYSCDQGCGAWTTQTIARNIAKEDRTGTRMYKHSFSQAPSVPPHCEHCGFKMHLGGPMWAGPLHNPYFVQRILDRIPSLDRNVYGTLDRVRGMLTVALEEDLTLAASNTPDNTNAPNGKDVAIDPRIIPRLPPDVVDRTPFFFIPNYLAKVLHTQTPGEDAIRGAIRGLGYKVTRSHCKAGSFKTDAPWDVIWEILREWERQKSPAKEGAVKPGTAGWRIMRRAWGGERRAAEEIKDGLVKGLEKVEGREELGTVLRAALWKVENEGQMTEAKTRMEEGPAAGGEKGLKVVFDEALGKEKPREKLVRYQINPRSNWGPMNRAGGS
ncbi:N2,N2-dimethylguanosine tRNA methyltransferase [Cyphellophora europaea CBS 101466]|uniref:tRNA (guanine(26)-N(2))-dimethyltransferase n=1 Tax=Cyphellophora europaea (strain CBS 101466) TaxID=1220924 RepID=W2S4B8_CYPE1|nr:N2,N2-dimethylguanosine tRNA methyltransferase [Cyphellophora europaea CBS 101466]ETN42814.1 N2,N2-dimethylguanosine tRNA methyltransferase [Cyphellophora europaea CBS 101466]